MNKFRITSNWHALARMASEQYQRTYIDRASNKEYVIPDELLDNALSFLRWTILHSKYNDKEPILDLYLYCNCEANKAPNDKDIYDTKEWRNINSAIKGFLIHTLKYDLTSWETQNIRR